MTVFENITIGIASSIIFAIIIWFYRNHFLKYWYVLLSVLFAYKKIGIVRIHRNRTTAIKYLSPLLLKSPKINVIQFKGYSLIDSQNRVETTLYKLVTNPESRIQEINFLLLNPGSENYIKKRITELHKNNLLSDYNHAKQDIEHSIKVIESINKLELKLKCNYSFFDEELKWNLLILDEFVLIGFYVPDISATKGLSILVTKNSLLGSTFNKYFTDLWSKSYKNMKEKKEINFEQE